jgi:hypothetical protein
MHAPAELTTNNSYSSNHYRHAWHDNAIRLNPTNGREEACTKTQLIINVSTAHSQYRLLGIPRRSNFRALQLTPATLGDGAGS